MKKRILCLILVLLMVLSAMTLLASCKKDDKPSNQPVVDTKKKDDSSDDEDEDEEEIVEVATPLWEGSDKTKSILFCIHDALEDVIQSGGRGYIAGNNEWTENSAQANNDILKLVATRNSNAAIYGNVNVKYDYSTWTWGNATKPIHTNVLSGVAGQPDVYYQNVYDMVASSIKGDFKDIKGNQYLTNSEDDNGYNNDYMDILSFSSQKLYLIASDYCTDIARSFYILPVSIDILQSKQALGENQSTTADFYDLIDNNGWTWDVIATMCNNVKTEAGTGGYVYNDGVVGMAVDTYGGMAAAGMLYSSPVRIINRTLDNDGEYVYTYDSAGESLRQVAVKLEQTIGATDGFVTNSDAGTNRTPGEAIAQAFSEGHILIGNVTILGAIESQYYRSMWDTANEKNGFVVAPMPLYTEGTAADGWSYITVVHNTAKVLGIAANSSNKDRCVAYIDFCSRHSTDILDEFFQWTILYDAAGADEKNVEYLINMKSNMAYNLDKTVDDALAIFGATYSPNGESLYGSNRYHKVLELGNAEEHKYFKVGGEIVTIYQATYANKEAGVQLIQQDVIAGNKAN